MKTLRYLFSAILFVAVWAATSAQNYTADTEWDQSDGSFLYDGSKVALYSASNEAGYLNGENTLLGDMTSDCAYTLVAAGRNAEDESPLWFIQQVSTGKYIKFGEFFYMSGMGGSYFELTETIGEALAFTIQQNCCIEEDGIENATPRNISSNANQDLSDYAWVICSEYVLNGWTDPVTKVEHDTLIYFYLGSAGAPQISTYYDSNCWWIYPLSEAVAGEELLKAAWNDYANDCNPQRLTSGIDPGCYGAAEIEAYTRVYEEAEEQLQEYSYTDEQSVDLAERLKAAREALDATLVTFQAGKHYMFASNASYGAGLYLHWNGSAWNFAAPADVSEVSTADAAFYFYVEDAGTAEDGTPLYHLKNFDAGNYITSNYSDGYNIPGGTTATLKIALRGEDSQVENAYNIIDTNESAPNKGIFSHAWNGLDHSLKTLMLGELRQALFTVKALPEDAMAELENALAAEKLIEELAQIVGASKELITSTKVYRPSAECTLDGQLDNPGLVTSESQLSSNADHNAINPGALDGEGFPGLLDGDVTTFFHSAWKNAPTETHFIDADLMQEVDGISLKLARRNHNNQGPTPVRFDVYASTDSLNWVSQGVLGVDYDYDYKEMANDTILVNHPDSVVSVRTGWVGVGALPFNGNYRYVRLAVPATHTEGGTTIYFYLSELRYYAGAIYDVEASVYDKAPETKRMTFEAALAKAEEALAEQKATQAIIDELQKAYEELVEAIPSTDDLLELIAAYNAIIASCEEGEGVGFYAVGSKATFEAVVNRIANSIDVNWGVNEINAAEDEIMAAYETFMAGFQLPEEGKLYAIRPMSKEVGYIDQMMVKKCGQYLSGSELYIDKDLSAHSYGIGAGGEFVEGRDCDEVELASSYNYLWAFEYNATGDSVYVRNAATGFYIGSPKTTDTPHPFALSLYDNYDESKVVGKNNFVFTMSNGAVLSTNQVIGLVSGSDASDANSAFRIEEITGSDQITHKATAYPEIISLPYTITSYTNDGYLLEVLGVRTEGSNKYVVLGEITESVIEAGEPFVYWPEDTSKRTVGFELCDEFGKALGGAAPTLSLEGKDANGMVGVVLGGFWIQPSIGRVDKGVVKATKYEYKTVSHAGYIVTDRLGKEVESEGYDLLYTGEINVASAIEGLFTKTGELAKVYSIDGRFVGRIAPAAVKALPAGIYIVDGKKVLVK